MRWLGRSVHCLKKRTIRRCSRIMALVRRRSISISAPQKWIALS
ncbi:Uncharacterised protein [Vibrio cholerae]|nr:Uncharacterised protein [Vibrio cholerae]